jgi:hypothetical protein
MEILTYIEFPQAGAYQLIFNSDDGFRTLAGNKSVDVIASPIFSQADVGRGAVDTVQNVYVPQAGIFPFRSVWFNGGGGANLEWVGVNLVTGVKALLNDSTTPGALKTYRVATGTFPAAVTYAYPDRSSGNPYFPTDPVTIEITDGSAQVNNGSIRLSINDAPVTVTPSKLGAITKIQYNPPAPWASGSNNKITLVWSDNAAPPVVWSNSWNFTVHSWVTVPPTAAIGASAVDTSKVGFKIKTHKADQQNDLANTSARALAQLAGANGANKLDTSALGADGYYVETAVINYEQGALTPATAPYEAASVLPARAGNFTDQIPSDRPVADLLLPGEPITDATYASLVYSNKWNDNLAMQALTVLELQPGFYWSGVNSDDGFRVSFAANPLDALPIIPNVFEGGKGPSDVNGLFQITQAGLYPVQLLWYEGGGGASVEWYIQNTLDYQRTLVNDAGTPGYVKAYQYPVASTGAAYVKSFTPANGAPRVGLGKPIQVVLVDGSTPVDQNSIKLLINGTQAGPLIMNHVGTETTVSYAQPLAASTVHNVEIQFSDSLPRSGAWSFTTGVLPGNTFVIEAEDFNTGGGQTVATGSTMPYFGNAYSNLSAIVGIDFLRPHQSDSDLYRKGETNALALAGYPTLVNQPMDATGDVDRGGWDLTVNYKLGWIGDGYWYDYTRTFPNGNYNVYAAVSHGDPSTSATRIGGSLQFVTAGATTTNQTLVQLGTFDGPATGGWGVNRLLPLLGSSGNVASLAIQGQVTFRYTSKNGDYDFIAFVPATGPAQPRFDPPTLSGGTVRIAWTGAGVLQEASNLTGSQGDWTDVANPTNPYPVTPGASARKFYRLRP